MNRWLLVLPLLAACEPAALPAPPPAPAPAAPVEKEWAPPAESEIPAGPLGDSIRNGMDLVKNTAVRLPEYVPSNMNCTSCHIDGGRQQGAAPLSGVYARFPKYMERTGAVIPLQDRVNYCFTRSMAGSRLPTDSKEMVDIMAYLAWLSKDVPVGGHVKGEAMPEMPDKTMRGDAARGEKLYTDKGCVSCHQADGGGVPGAFPAIWGPKSYSIGASMAREERAATFIKQFMPQTARGSLTDQEAFDLSAFINSHPRPDSPGKENDWPEGGAPWDVPYATQGHEAYKPPEYLERAKPETTVVPKPPTVVVTK